MSNAPHAILYVFQVKKGHEKAFESAWCDVTREIHEHCGSLGSRLHTWVEGPIGLMPNGRAAKP